MSISMSALNGPLGVDDGEAVLDRLERALIGDPARDLVGQPEAEPERELEEEVPPAVREKSSDSGHAASLASVSVRFSPGFGLENWIPRPGSAADVRHLDLGQVARVSAVRSSE